jgi:copper chaperone CopZ
MATQTHPLTGLHCQGCVRRITAALSPMAERVEVTLEPMQVVLHNATAPLAQLQAAVAATGKYTLSAAHEPMAAPSPSWWATYRPLLLIVGYLLAASVLIQLGQHLHHGMGLGESLQAVSAMEAMRYFMAGFFLVFSFFKLLDVEAFANAYAGYDLLAARWQPWGFIYPYVELALGLLYLTHIAPAFTHWATLIVMGFSAIGVVRAVMSKQQIQCACLGTVFKLPMSTVTIVEDVGMVAMAAGMLIWAGM